MDCVKFSTLFKSTLLREMDSTTKTVFPLFLPRFAAAICQMRFPESLPLRDFFPAFCSPWYFIASTGEILPAALPGLLQLMRTVTRAKTAAAAQVQTGGSRKPNAP